MSNKSEEIVKLLPCKEQQRMLEANPYRSSFWGFPDHDKFNATWAMGWLKGRNYAVSELLDYMREKDIGKAALLEYFQRLFNDPNFGVKKEGK